MSSTKSPTESSHSTTDQPRRKFLKTALAGAFAAPVVTSLAVDHLMNTARAQQAYVAPNVVSFIRLSPSQGMGSVNYATYQVTFSQPIDTGSYPCWTLEVFNSTGCSGGVLNTYFGNSYPPGDLSWSNGNQTLTITNVDETGGGQHSLADGSVRLIVNGTCPGQLLGTNGLAVVSAPQCATYNHFN